MATRMEQVMVAAKIIVDQMEGGTDDAIVASYANMLVDVFAAAWDKPREKLLGLLRQRVRMELAVRQAMDAEIEDECNAEERS